MAEFALGLTKTAVQGTLNQVKSALEEEAKLRVRVQEDLVFITGEFQMLQSFLKAPNTGGRASQDLVVRTWVKQLRELAFDVEDCVEFVVHLDKASPWDWVRRLTSSLLICVTRQPPPLDVAVVEIKRLKARVEDIGQRNTRYNLFSTNGGGGDNPSDEHQLVHHTTSTSSTSARMETFHVLREVWKSIGKLHHTTGELKKLIDCQGSELKVISIWQSPQADLPGELGWMTAVKKAYDDPEICQEFKNRAWVRLCTHQPFNPTKFLNMLLSHFAASRPHHRHHDNISELMLQVSEHRYLIVLEPELSSIADWHAIRMCLPDSKNGSRIVIFTKHLGVAIACVGDPYEVSELKHFSHDRYLCAIFPKGCSHRTCMGEFFWQLRRRGSVISLFHQPKESGLVYELQQSCKSRVFHGVKFERQCRVYVYSPLKLVDLARKILVESYPEDEQASENEKLRGVDDQDINKRCRKFLTEHDYLIFIDGLKSTTDWDPIKQHLLCKSTGGCIVVITQEKSVATHCVDHKQYRALNIRDLVNRASDQQDQSGHADGGSDIKEKGEVELDALVGREDEEEQQDQRGHAYGESDSNIQEEGEGEEEEEEEEEEEGEFKLGTLIGREYEQSFFGPIKNYTTETLSVWGIAGVGKSAIVRAHYNRMISEEKKRCRALLINDRIYGWVDVPHPFNLTDFGQRLLLDIYSDDADAKEAAAIAMMEGQDPIPGCCKILSENECLIVINGLRSTHDWDLIKTTLLPSQPINGTRTIVITREERVATHCCPDEVLNVNGLQTDVSLDLLTKTVGRGRPWLEMTTEIKAISKVIISKCGGLPRVIVALGERIGRIVDKQGYYFSLKPLNDINDDFIAKLYDFTEFPSLRDLFCWMQSYFDACSDELKPCIFYMSVFTAGQSIRLRRLLRRWNAEGYLSGGNAEEKGKNLVLELMQLSILYQEEQQQTSPTNYKLNHFVREYIKSRAMDDNRVFELDRSCSPSPQLTAQHLTISSSWDRDEIVFKSMDLSRLRSLTVYGEWKRFLMCDKMKVLRVLDLEGTGSTCSVTDDDLELIGELLPRLKFISLRGCMKITHLPDSLGAMRHMETLDAKDTSIIELPPAIITKLQKLQYFRVGKFYKSAPTERSSPPPTPATPAQEDSHDGTSPLPEAEETLPMPGVVQGASTVVGNLEESRSSWWQSKDRRRRCRLAANGGGVEVARAGAEGIGKLTGMHTLGVVNVAGGKGAFLFLKELKKLTQLRKLLLSGITRKTWQKLCSAISGHRHLEILALQLLLLEEDGNYDFACFDDIPEPPKTLRRLKVLYTTNAGAGAGGARISPIWFRQLGNIESFDHELTISSQEDIDIIFADSQVSKHRFRIKPMQQHISFHDYDDPKCSMSCIVALRIECSRISNSTVTLGHTSMPVKEPNIHCCSSCGSSCLRIIGLERLDDLEQVLVTGPCNEDLKEDLRKQLEEHPNKPELKLL